MNFNGIERWISRNFAVHGRACRRCECDFGRVFSRPSFFGFRRGWKGESGTNQSRIELSEFHRNSIRIPSDPADGCVGPWRWEDQPCDSVFATVQETGKAATKPMAAETRIGTVVS